MSQAPQATGDPTAPVGDDAVRPFAVESLDIRGRAVQMGGELDAILGRHDYPAPVSRLLAEAIVLTALLGSSLKIDGRFTLQTETDGPVDLLVVDYRSGGAIRAYARFDSERVSAADGAGPADLLGEGRMAMTVDQGSLTTRYQGIVQLTGEDDLQEVAHTYFRQSEQIPTRVRLAVAELQVRGADGVVQRGWRAGGLLVQFLPRSPERARMQELTGDVPDGVEIPEFEEDDAWTEAQALIETVEDIELTDPAVPVERLLFRLFNQRGVRVFDPLAVRDECSCSSDKVEGVLAGFSADEISEATKDGVITARCEFCGRGYAFDPAKFAS